MKRGHGQATSTGLIVGQHRWVIRSQRAGSKLKTPASPASLDYRSHGEGQIRSAKKFTTPNPQVCVATAHSQNTKFWSLANTHMGLALHTTPLSTSLWIRG